MTAPQKNLSDEKAWREFEIDRWRAALRGRGLQLRSLAPEHQQALFERVRPTFGWHKAVLMNHPRLTRPFWMTGRALAMAALIAIGYAAHDGGSIAGRLVRIAAAAGSQQSCALAYTDLPPTSEAALTGACDSSSRP